MFRIFAPNLQLDNVSELSVEQVRALGIRGLLLDLDCTLKDYHSETVPERVLAWLDDMRNAGVRMCLLSNGKPRRIARFSQALGMPYVAKAFKPLPFGCYRGLRTLALPATETAVVGDQLFADVLAGRLAGLFTVLVRPTSPAEPWFTRLKRPFERFVLRQLNARRLPSTRLIHNLAWK
ncbi:MAG: YqeG family HAD IIIA-type phosphatase [Gemmataceae bacterium]|nr:YqeG family HAD IIIA-type phosphatase [Gemmataceae bacterium]MCI0743369.1 YqeG family HAD IIIA-type phosphatase [Gemmataceae bacterium]